MALLRIVAVCLLCVGGYAMNARGEVSTSAAFKSDVRPILKALCYECHSSDDAKGGIRFDQLDPDLVSGRDAETWHDVLNQLNSGEMPPQQAKQPTSEQRKVLTDWLLAALREATEAKRHRDG
ncbi:MAG: hypothetical protein NXI22_06480, partial [bacterium]|nr:hypothetical protein [bacterium]